MINVTDSPYRNFVRLLTKESLLYTPMIHARSVIKHSHPHSEYMLNPIEYPTTFQIAGCDPKILAEAVKKVALYPY